MGELLKKDPASREAIELITKFGVETGEQMTKDWRNFWMFLFSHVRDGFTVFPAKKKQCVGKQRKDCTSRVLPDAVASVTQKHGTSALWQTAKTGSITMYRRHISVIQSSVLQIST